MTDEKTGIHLIQLGHGYMASNYLPDSNRNKAVAAFSNITDLINWLPGYFGEDAVDEKCLTELAENTDAVWAALENMARHKPPTTGPLPPEKPVLDNRSEQLPSEQDAPLEPVETGQASAPAENSRETKQTSNLTEAEQRLADGFDLLALKLNTREICITAAKLAEFSGVKEGSIKYISENLLLKGFLSNIHRPGKKMSPTYRLAEGWQ